MVLPLTLTIIHPMEKPGPLGGGPGFYIFILNENKT